MPTPEELAKQWGLTPPATTPKQVEHTPESLMRAWGLDKSSHELRVDSSAKYAKEAAPELNRQHEIQFYRQLGEISDPDLKLNALQKAEPHLKVLRGARKKIGKAIGEAGRSGTPEDVATLADATKQANVPDPSLADTVVDYAGKGEKVLGWGLNYLAKHALRPALTPGGTWWDEPLEPEDWLKKIHEASAAGHPIAAPFDAATNAVGTVAGYPLAAVGLAGLSHAGIVGDFAKKALAKKLGAKDEFDLFLKAGAQAAEQGGDAVKEASTDPLTYLSLGAESIGKNAISSVTRQVTKSLILGGAEKAVARGVAKEIAEQTGAIIARDGVTREALGTVRNILTKVMPQSKIEQQFGKNLELLGRGQMRLGLPFGPGFDVLPTLTGQENLVGRGLQNTLGKALQAGGAEPLFSRTAENARSLVNQAKGWEAKEGAWNEARLEKLAQTARELQALPEVTTGEGLKRAPLAPKDLIERHVKPRFEIKKAGDPSIPRGAVTRDIGNGEVAVAGPSFLPASALSKEELGFLDQMQLHLDATGEKLVNKGVIASTATDPISGRYFPGKYTGRYGWLSDITDPLQGYGLTKSRVKPTGGARTGATGFIRDIHDLETSPWKALDPYYKQATRKLAKTHLEEAVVNEFGVDMAKLTNNEIRKRGWKEVEGTGKAIPAAVHGVLNGTLLKSGAFETHWNSFASLVRKVPGAERTAFGRGVIRAADVLSEMGSGFKNRVLVNRPAFHVVNLVNDTMQMTVAGVNNPAGEVRRARKILEAVEKGENLAIKIGGETKTAKELLELAQSHNVATSANVEQRLQSFGSGRDLKTKLERIASGRPPEGAYEKLTGIGGHVADEWEKRSRLALFLWGIEKGKAPAEAAAFTRRILLDYGDRGRALQVARWVAPFITWAVKAPAMVGELALTRPGRLANYKRVLHAFGDKDRVEPKEAVRERGDNLTLGPIGQGLAGSMIKGLGGTPGAKEILIPRDFASEGLQLPAELLQGLVDPSKHANWDPLLMQAGPLTQLAATHIMKRDPVTKQDFAEGTSPGAIFPPNTPLASQFGLTASPGQLPWGPKLTSYLPWVGTPYGTLATNYAFNKFGGKGAPVAVAGAPREYSSYQDPDDIYARGLWSATFGFPLYSWDPSQPLGNRATSIAVKRWLEADKSVKDSRKSIERNQR